MRIGALGKFIFWQIEFSYKGVEQWALFNDDLYADWDTERHRDRRDVYLQLGELGYYVFENAETQYEELKVVYPKDKFRVTKVFLSRRKEIVRGDDD